jgi:hypothetical protein
VWTKLDAPVMAAPPPGLGLTCWRDPYCLERGDPSIGREWALLLASGLRGRGGAVVVFRSPKLLSGALVCVVFCDFCGGDRASPQHPSRNKTTNQFNTTKQPKGWRFEGLVAAADTEALGIDWECAPLCFVWF